MLPLPTWRLRPLAWGVLALGAVGCIPLLPEPPLGGDRLAYRVQLDQGLSVLGGQVLAPSLLQGAPSQRRLAQSDPLAEAPVAGATLEVVNPKGERDDRFEPFRADAQGRFTLRGLPVNEAVYLRATFPGPDGKPRRLYAYVRPQASTACTSLNFATTLLASHLCTAPDEAFPLFLPAELAKLEARVQRGLPQALAGSLAQGLPALRQRLDAVATREVPGGCLPQAEAGATRARAPGDLLDQVFAVDPSLPRDLDRAVETYLHITLTLQQLGANQSSLPKQRQQLKAQTELQTEVPQGRFTAFAYWLNDQKIAEASYAEGKWRAKLDTRAHPNGTYVLSAIATPKGQPAIVAASLLVQINNQGPVADPCGSPAATPAASAPATP